MIMGAGEAGSYFKKSGLKTWRKLCKISALHLRDFLCRNWKLFLPRSPLRALAPGKEQKAERDHFKWLKRTKWWKGCRKGESPGKPGGWWSAAGTSTTASDRRPSARQPSWDWEIQFPSWCFSKAPGVHITRYVVAWHRWHIVTRWTRPVQMQCQ